MYNNFVQEYLELSPKFLTKYDSIENIDVYSNATIEKEIIKVCYNSRDYKRIAPTIERGINNRKIIIGYTKSSFKMIKEKIKKYIMHDILNYENYGMNSAGIYDHSKNRIYVLLDNSTTLFGELLEDINKTIVHELNHYYVSNNTRKYFNYTFEEYLLPFYKTLCKNIDEKCSDIQNPEYEDLVKSLIKLETNKTHTIVFKKLFKIWNNLFKNIYNKKEDKEILKKRVREVLCLFMYISIDQMIISPNDMNKILKIYKQTYRQTFNINIGTITLPGQEACFPSEITSILIETKKHNKLIRMINSINFD